MVLWIESKELTTEKFNIVFELFLHKWIYSSNTLTIRLIEICHTKCSWHDSKLYEIIDSILIFRTEETEEYNVLKFSNISEQKQHIKNTYLYCRKTNQMEYAEFFYFVKFNSRNMTVADK